MTGFCPKVLLNAIIIMAAGETGSRDRAGKNPVGWGGAEVRWTEGDGGPEVENGPGEHSNDYWVP